MRLKAESSILPGGLNSSGEGWQPAGQPAGRGGVRGELALSSLARLSVLVYGSGSGADGRAGCRSVLAWPLNVCVMQDKWLYQHLPHKCVVRK